MASRLNKELKRVYPYHMEVIVDDPHNPEEIQYWLIEKFNNQPKGKFGRWFISTVLHTLSWSYHHKGVVNYTQPAKYSYRVRVYFKSVNDYLMFKMRWS